VTDLDLFDEQRSVRLKQRLWGAAVLIALAVIFLPLLLDGAGSESEYRRVERLREEPPRLTGDATLDTNKLSGRLKENAKLAANATTSEPAQGDTGSNNTALAGTDTSRQIQQADRRLDRSSVAQPNVALNFSRKPDQTDQAESNTAQSTQNDASASADVPSAESTDKASGTDLLSAWVVQAGSFRERENALAVRDRLRRAGFPSFVTETDVGTLTYRVQVGPMINLQQAERSRDKVMSLLKREAIVISYP